MVAGFSNILMRLPEGRPPWLKPHIALVGGFWRASRFHPYCGGYLLVRWNAAHRFAHGLNAERVRALPRTVQEQETQP